MPDSHLYTEDDGTIKDAHIEDVFKSLYEDVNLDKITQANLGLYVGQVYPDMPAVPEDIFTNDSAALEWALSAGVIQLARIVPSMHTDPDIERLGLSYIGKLLRGDNLPVFGKSPGRTAVLAVVQAIREHIDHHNNVTLSRSNGGSA